MRNDVDYVPEDPSNTYSPGAEPTEEVAKMRSAKTNPVIMSKQFSTPNPKAVAPLEEEDSKFEQPQGSKSA